MAADKERGHGTASAEIGKYLDILAKDPHSRVFAPLAEAYRKAGLVDDAIATALEGLKVHPNYLGGRVALGRAYFEKRQYTEAAAEMERVVASAPDNLMAHRVLGQIAFARNDLPSAEKAFRMVLLLDPGDQEARQFVARAGGASPAFQTPAQSPPPAVMAPPAPRPEEPPPPAFESIFSETIHPPEGPEQQPSAPPEEGPLEAHPPPTGEIAPGLPGELAIESPPELAEAEELSSPAPPASVGETEEIEMDLSEEFEIKPPLEPAEAGVPLRPDSFPAATGTAQEPGPNDGLELEVFTRVAWGEGGREPEVPESEEVAAPEEESPIEIFGRSKRGTARLQARGGQTPFREISFEPADQEGQPAELQPEEESPFEIFTREPAVRSASSPPGAGGGEEAGKRDIEIETTAYLPPDSFAIPAEESPVPGPEEELPRLDLTREIELGAPEKREPASGQEPVPQAEPHPGIGIPALSVPPSGLDVESGPAFEFEQAPAREPEPLPGPMPDNASESALEPWPEPEPEPAEPSLPPAAEPKVETGPAFLPAPDFEPAPMPEPYFEHALKSSPPDVETEPEWTSDTVRECGPTAPPEPAIEPAPEPELPPGAAFEPASGLSSEPEPDSEFGPAAPSVDQEPGPDVEPGPEFAPDRSSETTLVPEPPPTSEPRPPFAALELAVAARQMSPQASPAARIEEEYEELSEEESSPASSRAGVFDTETLAAIYVNQGFFGRAAAIYQRLLVQRPGDVELRRKLDELSVLERAGVREGAGAPSALTAEPEPAVAADLDTPEARVDRLERLLEAFRRERPR
jgi:tetratricopeptide (TPR) repeat protein